MVDQTPLQQTQKNVNRLMLQLRQLGRIGAFAFALTGLRELAEDADRLINLENRLSTITNSAGEFETAFQGVVDISRRTYTSIEDTAAVLQRYTQVTKHLGVTQQEVLGFTETLTKAMKLGGSSQAEVRGALIQLGQGIGTDFKAGGQELNSILEQSTTVAQILADAVGVPIGRLKEMAKAGKLSGRVVFDAITNAGKAVNKLWEKRKMTFADLGQVFSTEWLLLVKQMEGGIDKVIRGILKLIVWFQEWVEKGEAMNSVISASIVAFGLLTAVLAPLAAEVALVVAPFVALFLVLEDIVTFLRGGDSLFGRLMDTLGELFGITNFSEVARESIKNVGKSLLDLLNILKNPEEFGKFFKFIGEQIAEWIGKAVDTAKVRLLELSDVIAATLRDALGERISGWIGLKEVSKERRQEAGTNLQNVVNPIMQAPIDAGKGIAEHFSKYNVFSQLGEMLPSWENATSWATNLGRTTNSQAAASPVASTTVMSQPQVTNNVTVYGADGQTARNMSSAVQEATMSSLERDRAAIASAVGVE